jgi:hypothetical protein
MQPESQNDRITHRALIQVGLGNLIRFFSRLRRVVYRCVTGCLAGIGKLPVLASQYFGW